MKKASRAGPAGAMELVEEAVHLLRGAPAGLHAIYAAGTLPFILAFLYFWADMSRGAFAREHAGAGAAAMGLLYCWMKCGQAVYAAELRARFSGRASAPWTARRLGRLALTQIALQPSGLFAVPAALLIALPFGWVAAFYQNLTAVGGAEDGPGGTFKTAAGQASLRAGENHLVLGVLLVFGFFVWVNVAMTMAVLPNLVRMLFGIDSTFTQAGARSVLNTTYLACSFALTYVFVDPLVKAVYVLRCFYGQSLHTGEDLKADLARVRAPAAVLAAVVCLSLACSARAAATATPAEARAPTSAVSPSALNQAIAQVLQQREFAWRMPRAEAGQAAGKPKSWIGRAAQAMVDGMRESLRAVGRGLGDALEWLGKLLQKLWRGPASSPTDFSGWGSAWMSSLRFLLVILILGIAGFLGVVGVRLWRRRRRSDAVVAEAVAARPDLNDENVGADQLPEEGWLKMARELIEQGNLRLALRALYLAGLAHLAERELIAIAIFKSNREYDLELRRRARALPDVQSAFQENVAVFDRVWYGLHEVTREALLQFQSNLERIRAC